MDQETREKLQGLPETIMGAYERLGSGSLIPGVAPVAYQLPKYNDLTQTVETLTAYIKDLVDRAEDRSRELEAERIDHVRSQEPIRALSVAAQTTSDIFETVTNTTLRVYESVKAEMALKSKEEEHKLAMARTTDILAAARKAYQGVAAIQLPGVAVDLDGD